MKSIFIIVNTLIVLACIAFITLRIVTYMIAKDNALTSAKYKFEKYDNVYKLIFKLLLVTGAYCIALGACSYIVILHFNGLNTASKGLRIMFTLVGMLGELILMIKAIIDFAESNNQAGVIMKKLGVMGDIQDTGIRIGKIRISLKDRNNIAVKDKAKTVKKDTKQRDKKKDNGQVKTAGVSSTLVKDIVDVGSSLFTSYVNNQIKTSKQSVNKSKQAKHVERQVASIKDTYVEAEIDVLKTAYSENKDKAYFQKRDMAGI